MSTGYEAEEETLCRQYGPFHSVAGELADGRTVYCEVRAKNNAEAGRVFASLDLKNIKIKNIDE